MTDLAPDLARNYDLDEIAAAVGMSARWVRQRCKEGAEHQRMGHKIKMTARQIEKLREAHTVSPVTQSITTGRGRRKSA